MTVFGAVLILAFTVAAFITRDRGPAPKSKAQHRRERAWRSARKREGRPRETV